MAKISVFVQHASIETLTLFGDQVGSLLVVLHSSTSLHERVRSVRNLIIRVGACLLLFRLHSSRSSLPTYFMCFNELVKACLDFD